jgi:hypothetical protein
MTQGVGRLARTAFKIPVMVAGSPAGKMPFGQAQYLCERAKMRKGKRKRFVISIVSLEFLWNFLPASSAYQTATAIMGE